MDPTTSRNAYPSDVSDEEWAFITPYLTLTTNATPQCDHDLREVFNGLRWIVHTRSAWRYLPHDLRRKHAVRETDTRRSSFRLERTDVVREQL